MGVQVIGDNLVFGVDISGLHALDDLMVSQHFFLLELVISDSIFRGMEGTIFSMYL